MNHNLQLFNLDTNEQYEFNLIKFPAGEPHVTINKPLSLVGKEILIDARITDMFGLMSLFVLTDAVRNLRPRGIHLLLPYIPGGRQDRITPGSGNGCTLRVVAELINLQKYATVYTIDPHSDVTPALFNNLVVIDHSFIVESFVITRKNSVNYIITPDAGAEKRNKSLIKQLKCDSIVAGKTRDPNTGALSGFTLPPLPATGNYLILDDLCDGGGTFLGLAKLFRSTPRGQASMLYLWTTHGIYSKGIDLLLETFDGIGSTNSFLNEFTAPHYFKFVLTLNDLRHYLL